MRFLILCLMLLSAAGWAKPWNGIDPGLSTRDEVVNKFGEPSKVTAFAGHEVLTYLKERAIKGTVQSQFRIEKESRVVDRIDVFPEPKIDADQIEENYGAQCAPGEQRGCYQRRAQGTKPPYFFYTRLGLAIFFREDGKTVHSFTFLPAKK